jgi:hypothetical protein
MSLPAELQSIVRECRQRKWEVKLFDMTLESGVVILALGANRDTRHGWILGSACSWHDPLAAARHALDEVKLAVLFHRPEPRPKRSVPREVRSLWDHQRLYCNPVIQKKASFLFEGSHVRFTDLAPKGDAASLRKRLPLSAESPISVDLTDQLPFAPPYAAVKVIVPGLIPLTFGYCREPFGMPRLTSLARSFRLQRTARPATPHPFT